MSPTRGVYAANVNHYNHVLDAMSSSFDEVTLYRNWKPRVETLERLRRWRVPNSVVSLVARRARAENLGSTAVNTLGPAQFLHPLGARLGVAVPGGLHRRIIASTASRVMRDDGGDVLQFVEGLGYRALRRGRFAHYVCERRNLHHEVFAQPLHLWGGFPARPHADPISDILEQEYAGASRIVVYSEVAARSFFERGYSRARVAVIPLALPEQLPRTVLRRSAHTLAYVGRGDAYKGLDVAVEATRLLGPPYRLSVAGPMRSDVKRWLMDQPHVDYLGILERSGLRTLYSTAAMVLAPSVESFGLAVFEALHHGCLVLMRETTGISDYTPEGLRNIVVGRDPKMWAEAVRAKMHEVEDEEPRTLLADQMAGYLTWSAATQRQRLLFNSLG